MDTHETYSNFPESLRHGFLLIGVLPLLGACGFFSGGAAPLTEKPLTDNGSTANAVFSAALTPLEDIGIRKRKIPQMLDELGDNPYARPSALHCETVKEELRQLAALIGPDMDSPKETLSAAGEYREAGEKLANDALVGFVRSQADFIPLRSIIRRLSGANAHEKHVARAIEAGKLRRAYLRGLADARFGATCLPRPKILTARAGEKNDSPGLEFVRKW